MFFNELLMIGSFYPIYVSLNIPFEKITKLYIVTYMASVIGSVAIEIVDIGSKKMKCLISIGGYGLSLLTIFLGGHYEMLLIGRIIYGLAAALLHSSFESYCTHEHTTRGFPDDWLTQTFALLAHCVAGAAVVAGFVGQTAASIGPTGPASLAIVIFIGAGAYIASSWSKDASNPNCVVSSLLFNVNTTITALKTNKPLLLLLAISCLFESSIVIFIYYWAPMLSNLASVASGTIPYELVYSSFVMMQMLGNYMYQLYAPSFGEEVSLGYTLIAATVGFTMGGMLQTYTMAFFIGLVINFSVGVYWPAIGFLRGKIIVQEHRTTFLMLIKVVSLVAMSSILTIAHASQIVTLLLCAILTGSAVYLQLMLQQEESKFAHLDLEELSNSE